MILFLSQRWRVVSKAAPCVVLLAASEASSENEIRWESLRHRIYTGQSVGPLPSEGAGQFSMRRFEIPFLEEGPVSFGNIPLALDLSYLSIPADRQGVIGMGNLVGSDGGAGEFVQAVKTVLVTWAPASAWPEWAERDESGYYHPVEAGIYGVQRGDAGEILDFEYTGASECLIHVPWRPTVAPDGGPYPYNGHAFEVTIPFVDRVELPEEYVVLISYNTGAAGARPIGEPGPYDSLNYGLRKGEPRRGLDPDPDSLVQVNEAGWNYSGSWGGLGSIMTEVLSREEETMMEVSLDVRSNVGVSVTALYDGEDLVEQAVVRIRPREVTVLALDQERIYGDTMVLDRTAFEVLDLDGDEVLPNGESVDVVELESVTGGAFSTTSDAGAYADEIRITGLGGSNGFEAANYDVEYVAGDLVVNRREVTVLALDQERTYGDTMVLDQTAFEVLDLDGDEVLPNGESVDVVELESVTGGAFSTTSDAGAYADEIRITGLGGSNGFEAANYDVEYVAGDLVVNRREVTVLALDQERTYGDTMVLDQTAFEVLDLDGDEMLPNGESVDVVELESVNRAANLTSTDAGLYADEIRIVGQQGSNGFAAGNYKLTYVRGDLLIRAVVVEITLVDQEAFRCGRGRGLWFEVSSDGIEVEVEYDGAGSIPQTLGEHKYHLRIQDPNYVASQATGSFQVVERTYGVWSRRFLTDIDFAGPEDDPDEDGINNLLEFVLDTDPLAANEDSSVVVGRERQFSGVVAKEFAGVTLAVEASSDLQSWQEVVPSWETDDQVRVWSWASPASRRSFLRLRVGPEVDVLRMEQTIQ